VRKIETNDWWPKLVELKDELSLQELADRFGASAAAVRTGLKRTGTPRKRMPPGPRSRRRESLPPEAGEGPPPAPKGRHRQSKSHLIEPYEHLLGVRTDGEVAEMAGVSSVTVANYRSRAGIAAHRGPKPRKTKRKQGKVRASKIDGFVKLLGNVPDRVVAEKAGVSVGAVQHYRTKLGLPAHGRRQASARPALQPTTPSPPPQGMLAWKVTLATGDVVVVAAESLAAAATRSVTLGEVLALERVGPLV